MTNITNNENKLQEKLAKIENEIEIENKRLFESCEKDSIKSFKKT